MRSLTNSAIERVLVSNTFFLSFFLSLSLSLSLSNDTSTCREGINWGRKKLFFFICAHTFFLPSFILGFVFIFIYLIFFVSFCFCRFLFCSFYLVSFLFVFFNKIYLISRNWITNEDWILFGFVVLSLSLPIFSLSLSLPIFSPLSLSLSSPSLSLSFLLCFVLKVNFHF